MSIDLDLLVIKQNYVVKRLPARRNRYYRDIEQLPMYLLEDVKHWTHDAYGTRLYFIYARDLKPLIPDQWGELPEEILELPDDTKIGLLWW